MSTGEKDGETRGNDRKGLETDTAANLSLFRVTFIFFFFLIFRAGRLLPLRYNVAQPEAPLPLDLTIFIYILVPPPIVPIH